MGFGRPRTPIGTFGRIHTKPMGTGRFRARTRVRDLDGQLRRVVATGDSTRAAEAELKLRIANRTGYGAGGLLSASSPFPDLCELWLADLELRDIVDNTKDNYRDDLRLHVRPFFENYTLGEITTGRVEFFLKSERTVSYSRAKHSRTLLNQLFGFALRHDAISRNPVDGTSPLTKPKSQIQALTLEQVQALRAAAARWRTGPEVKGPKPDDQVKDLLEVLLGTSMRPGEALALRPVDITETRRGMVAHVCGTITTVKGKGTFRQDHPKTHASFRDLPVPDFAAEVLRNRLMYMTPAQAEVTIFRTRTNKPLRLHNVRRTFREFKILAGLEDTEISPRWYRRTGATVLARGLGVDVAATHLGHTSKAITEGYYIEPDQSIDFGTASLLERSLRPQDPDGTLLAQPGSAYEDDILDEIDGPDDEDEAAAGGSDAA
ncbi:tyrosine-type recombinase/integrase [Nocardioides panzhihuensis]|uniref:Integrase n=1 Tax=Nocardioides panzhihuensis TaxID=860243 RepID=A0A7Z0ITK0_9ACTN|nr:tyrosine-type recombinase/integrase [Nocardioides panzhihuensis]NYI78937.1 integrase [Nocardioides panzhihuensis]